MNTRTSYIIFVRPPGSTMWTQLMKPDKAIPWTSYDEDKANNQAVRICDMGIYCARVISVHHKLELDKRRYALMADGETLYLATE
jgi:hypothetical protein